MEVTRRKDVQNGGRSILKMTTGFGLFLSLSRVKIYYLLLFTSNLSYLNSFKLPYKIRLLGFRSPLISKTFGFLKVFNSFLSQCNILYLPWNHLITKQFLKENLLYITCTQFLQFSLLNPCCYLSKYSLSTDQRKEEQPSYSTFHFIYFLMDVLFNIYLKNNS